MPISRIFGNRNAQMLTYVTELTYPPDDEDMLLDPGTYTLHLDFVNDITAGTLVWTYRMGYCTTLSDCSEKTVLAASSNQSFSSSTTSPQNITLTSDTPWVIPGPKNSKWLFVEFYAMTFATGSVSIQMDDLAGGASDSYLEFAPALLPSPTPTQTQTDIPTLTPSPTLTATPTPGPTLTPTFTPDPTPTPTQIPSPTPSSGMLIVNPSEDTFIHSSNTSANYGARAFFGADGAPTIQSLLRFDVMGIPPGATISSATLRLYVSNSSNTSGALEQVSGSWSEATTTWDNAPAVGDFIADLSNPATAGAWSEADITQVISGDGTYDFYLTSSSSDSVTFNSREAGSNLPTLTVEYSWDF